MKLSSHGFSCWMKIILALAIIALIAGGGWFYHIQEQAIRKKVAEDLQGIARLKAQQIAT